MSAPATNAFSPAPVMTTTRTASSAPSAVNVWLQLVERLRAQGVQDARTVDRHARDGTVAVNEEILQRVGVVSVHRRARPNPEVYPVGEETETTEKIHHGGTKSTKTNGGCHAATACAPASGRRWSRRGVPRIASTARTQVCLRFSVLRANSAARSAAQAVPCAAYYPALSVRHRSLRSSVVNPLAPSPPTPQSPSLRTGPQTILTSSRSPSGAG